MSQTAKHPHEADRVLSIGTSRKRVLHTRDPELKEKQRQSLGQVCFGPSNFTLIIECRGRWLGKMEHPP